MTNTRQLSHPAALLLIVLFTAPILLMYLGTHEPTNTMELFNLVPTREAFREGHWLMPTLNGQPRFEKPPLCVWIPAGLARVVGNDSLWVTRLPSVLMAIIMSFATYMMGCAIFRNSDDAAGGPCRYALIAALVVPAMWAFDRHARLASYDIYASAFVMVSAAALVTIAEGGLRQVWLTVLAGVALGCSVLCKGPAPAATVMVPLFAWALIFHRRKPVMLAFLFAVLIGLVTSVPWVVAIVIKYPAAWAQWKAEVFKLSTSRKAANPEIVLNTKRVWYYYLQFFLWTAPFVPLFFAGLALPFLRKKSVSVPAVSDTEQRGRWMALIVLAGGLVLLSFPSVKEQRYVVQLLPFAAIMCVTVLQEFQRLPAERKPDLAAGLVLLSQSLFFIAPAAAGLIGAVYIGFNGSLPEKLRIASDNLEALNLRLVAMVSALFLAASVLLLYRQIHRQFIKASTALVVCGWIFAMIVQWVSFARAENYTNNWHRGIDTANRTIAGASLVTFHDVDQRPWLSTLYYFNRAIPEMTAEQMATMAKERPGEPLLVIVNLNAYGKPVRGAAENVAAVTRLTGRVPEDVATFVDENRETHILRFGPGP